MNNLSWLIMQPMMQTFVLIQTNKRSIKQFILL
jgi:hypothetical protein